MRRRRRSRAARSRSRLRPCKLPRCSSSRARQVARTRIARLQHRPHAASRSRRAPGRDGGHARASSVRAMALRLAMPPDAEHDAFVGPFHAQSARSPSAACSLSGKLEPHLAVALRIVAPALAHLHEQEEVHRLLERSRRSPCAPPAPIALMVCPPLPSTILRWLSRST